MKKSDKWDAKMERGAVFLKKIGAITEMIDIKRSEISYTFTPEFIAIIKVYIHNYFAKRYIVDKESFEEHLGEIAILAILEKHGKGMTAKELTVPTGIVTAMMELKVDGMEW